VLEPGLVVVTVLLGPHPEAPGLEGGLREDGVVLLLVILEEVAELVALDAEETFSLLLEATRPRVVSRVAEIETQHHPPAEVSIIFGALLAAVAVAVVGNLLVAVSAILLISARLVQSFFLGEECD